MNTNQDLHVTALIRSNERFVFVYHSDRLDDLAQVLGRFAANPELDFSWRDAGLVLNKARASTQEQKV